MSIGLVGITNLSTAFLSSALTSSGTLSVAFQTVNGAAYLYFRGEVQISSTAGTVQFGYASSVGGQTSTIYQLGTNITVKQID